MCLSDNNVFDQVFALSALPNLFYQKDAFAQAFRLVEHKRLTEKENREQGFMKEAFLPEANNSGKSKYFRTAIYMIL